VRSACAHAQPELTIRPERERAWTLLARLGWNLDKDRETIELAVTEHRVAMHAAIETTIPYSQNGSTA
jgi:hypothetical protein